MKTRSFWFSLALTACLVPWTAACGDSDMPADDGGDGDGDGHDHDHHDHGDGDTEVDTYEAGMTRMTVDGVFHVTLLETNPGPPEKGDNTMQIQIAYPDAMDTPLEGRTVYLRPYMPEHEHGTSPSQYDAVEVESGIYKLGPFDLFMPGAWELPVHIVGDNEEHDHVTFTFEIEG